MASSSTAPPLPPRKIRDLTPTTNPRPLEVKVTRTWDVQTMNSDMFEFILMDTDGDQIHRWVTRKLASDYEPLIFEDSIVHIEDFSVIEKRVKYFSPLRTQYNIVFTKDTTVGDIFDQLEFPIEKFNFIQFKDLKPMDGKDNCLSRLEHSDSFTFHSDNPLDRFVCLLCFFPSVTDVVGMFEYVSHPRDVAAGKRLQDLYIRNEKDESHKITFWNEDILLIPANLPGQIPLPILAITSTSMSDFAGKLRGYNLCRASIQQIYENEGWKYKACTKCRSKVTLHRVADYCFKCRTWDAEPDDRFRIQFQVADKYGTMDLTAFGETASDVLEMTMKQMKELEKKPGTGEHEVYDHLTRLIGQEFLFRIRIVDYNIKNPDKALTLFSISPIPQSIAKRARVSGLTGTASSSAYASSDRTLTSLATSNTDAPSS